MATNTLFYTWTVNKSFIANTPNNVKDIITRSCGWLNDNVLSGKYKPMNVFFSGSIKGNDVSFIIVFVVIIVIIFVVVIVIIEFPVLFPGKYCPVSEWYKATQGL